MPVYFCKLRWNGIRSRKLVWSKANIPVLRYFKFLFVFKTLLKRGNHRIHPWSLPGWFSTFHINPLNAAIKYFLCLDWILSLVLLFIKTFRHTLQKQPPEVFYKEDVLRNFAKFTGKQLCRDSVLIKLQALDLRPAGLQLY